MAKTADTNTSVKTAEVHIPEGNAKRGTNHPKPKEPILTNKLPTPVRVDRLAFYLENYPTHLKQTLIEGFSRGFKLGYMRVHECSEHAKTHLP